MPTKNKRQPNGCGSVRKRPDGRWEARYTCGFNLETGKQVQKSIYGKTRSEVQKKLYKVLYEIDAGRFIEPSKLTVCSWLDTWLKNYTLNIKPATYASYEEHIRVHLKPYLEKVMLQSLTPQIIQRTYNTLFWERHLSAKTLKNIHGVLHRALEQARKLGFIRDNPSEGAVLPRMEKPIIHTMDNEDLIAFLDAIKGNPYENVLFVTVFTGLRQGEVLGLTWDCVDFENHTLLINKQHNKPKGKKTYDFSSLKNDHIRLLTVAGEVMDVLRRQKAWQEEQADMLGSAWDNKKNLVFTTETGRYIANQALYRNFKAIMEKLGLSDMRFHDLRHTFAVSSLKAGDDIKTVQENLGHATASFTLSTYAHATMGMKKESAARMENFIQSLHSV